MKVKLKAESKTQEPGAAVGDAPPYPLARLAEVVGGELEGDGGVAIRAVNGIREAGPGEITFLSNARYAKFLSKTRASAVLLGLSAERVPLAVIRCRDPYAAFLKLLDLFARARPGPRTGIHPTAVLGPDVVLGGENAIGPYAVLEDGVRVGERTAILAGAYIGRGAALGDDCIVHPRAVVAEGTLVGHRVVIHSGAVIGGEGFGFYPDGGRYRKIPQIGRVVLGDDVEVGANSTIDRATVGETRIGRGVKIDNLVQIAHNVVIGEDSILCGQVGVSGSTEVGKGVTLAGQAGLVGHIRIGDGAKVGAQGGVTKSVPDGREVSGYPALPHALARRIYASMRRLPDALLRLRQLSERVERLEEKREP